MDINNINKDKIKVSLTDDEIENLFGSYNLIDYTNPHSRFMLNLILRSALPDYTLPLDCKRVLIEVKPEIKGCSIYFTCIYDKSPKKIKKINETREYALCFKNSNDMINCICTIDISKIAQSALYTNNGSYQLIIRAHKGFTEQILQISEFCDVYVDKTKISEIEEHNKLISCPTAIEKLASAFKEP